MRPSLLTTEQKPEKKKYLKNFGVDGNAEATADGDDVIESLSCLNVVLSHHATEQPAVHFLQSINNRS
jgi:hypothetical protein